MGTSSVNSRFIRIFPGIVLDVSRGVPLEHHPVDVGIDLDRMDLEAVWHPFTQMKEYAGATPVVIDRARGPWLFDTRGRRYIDGVASLWVGVHGHRDPDIDRAVRRQLGRVAHSTLLGLGSTAAAECATRLVEIAPAGLEHVFFSDNGSTAVEVALKMAFQSAAQRLGSCVG